MPAQRFRAVIRKQGPNPYVDVPKRVSRAFALFARAGRIRVEGQLNKVRFQATLIPLGSRGHRLFVNGGMRAAARVAIGDSVLFLLRPTHPNAIRLPADLVAALRRVQGARSAFNKLSLSHRRELLRYIDDARTTQTRQKRILTTVDHALGRSTPSSGRDTQTDSLWTCPRCGADFVNRNQFHSCKRYELSALFAGKPAHIRELFERFQEMVKACGPVKRLVYRDRIGFMVRVRFANAVPKARWLDVGFWLRRRVEHPRFHRIETIYPNAHVHVVRVTELDQLDPELKAWVAEATPWADSSQLHVNVGAKPKA